MVGGLLAYTVVRFRQRPTDQGQEPPQIYGSNQLEFAWTVIPIVTVLCALPEGAADLSAAGGSVGVDGGVDNLKSLATVGIRLTRPQRVRNVC